MSYFEVTPVGQITNRIQQIAVATQSFAEVLAGRFPLGLVRFGGSIVIAAYMAPILAAPFLIWFIANVIFAIRFAPRVFQHAAFAARSSTDLNGGLCEYFAQIRAFNLLYAFREENARVYHLAARNARASGDINRLTTTTGLVIRILNTGLLAAVLLTGLIGLSQAELTPGEFVVCIMLAGTMAADAGWFVSIWEGLTQNLGIIRDARATIDKDPGTIAAARPARLKATPFITIEKASFIRDNSRQTISDLSLSVPPGTRLGIVGPSGAGKSTLIDLLVRLHDVTSGSICFNGTDIRSLPLEQFRSTFAVVSQNDTLLHRSIAGNIALGTPDATTEASRKQPKKPAQENLLTSCRRFRAAADLTWWWASAA